MNGSSGFGSQYIQPRKRLRELRGLMTWNAAC
jgi:hypothetical protein